MGDFKDLRVWQEARSLAVLSSAAIEKLPRHERYVLGDQCAVRPTAFVLNLAEGNSRRGPREFRRYLDIARASLHEMEGILELAKALNYLGETELRSLCAKRANCARLIYAMLRRIEEAARRTS